MSKICKNFQVLNLIPYPKGPGLVFPASYIVALLKTINSEGSISLLREWRMKTSFKNEISKNEFRNLHLKLKYLNKYWLDHPEILSRTTFHRYLCNTKDR